MKTIIACGCSFTYGGNWSTKTNQFNSFSSYVDKLGQKLETEIINLSRPGASNYCIVKQIEHAITLNPDLIVFNITTSERIDYVRTGKSLYQRPSLINYNYDTYTNGYTENFSSEINSSTVMTAFTKKHDPTNNENPKDVVDFIVKYLNPEILADTNRLFILGVIRELEKNNIPYICINFSDIFKEEELDDINHISIFWREMNKKFPGKEDPHHFSEEGHKYLADNLYQYMIDHNIFL
jgi:hypothetical protein